MNINPSESVSGDLFIDDALVNPQHDLLDWYKLRIPQGDVNPKGGSAGNVQNFSITLTEFTSSDATLEEMAFDSEGMMTNDYTDTLEIWVYTLEGWVTGWNDMGGRVMYYDDGDPNDGWVANEEDNWTVHFRPAMDSQGTTEDIDGFTNSLTERGWIYICVRYFNILINADEGRGVDYTIDYTFEVERTSDSEINNYPISPSTTEGAGNDWKNATTTIPSITARSHSAWNYVDWYEMSGLDRSKIWNMTYNFSIKNQFGYGNHLGLELQMTGMYIVS